MASLGENGSAVPFTLPAAALDERGEAADDGQGTPPVKGFGSDTSGEWKALVERLVCLFVYLYLSLCQVQEMCILACGHCEALTSSSPVNLCNLSL